MSEANTPIRVMIVDDQTLMREGLSTLIGLEDGLSVVGLASDGRQAVEMANRLRPDVILMDVRMPHLDGISATREIKHTHPEIQVIILTTFDDDEYVFSGLRAGALGYLLKNTPAHELAAAIRKVARGEALLEPSVAAKLLGEFNRLSSANPALPAPSATPSRLAEELSEREVEVLRLAATGASNREIAAQLFITEGTVKNHISNILSKLGLRDRTQAVLYAVREGLIG
jgi:DNA-binding NarL/FixJ family response regulator